jgi:FtsH-binding integral membrane protein
MYDNDDPNGHKRDSFKSAKFFEDFADQSQLSPRVRRHLTTMYGHLAITALLALLACWLQINGVIRGNGLLPAVGGVAALWSLQSVTSPNLRQLLLYLFGFLEGLGLAPIVEAMYYLNPNLLLSALLSTALIFVSFSVTALVSPRRSFLYLGGIISSSMIILLVGSLFSMLLNSSIIDNAMMYIGLIMFAMLITFDTQVVVERVESSRAADPAFDAANMLLNIVAILRRLLVILAQREPRRDRRREKKRN